MKKFLLLTVFFLTACGPSQEEKENIAAVTCSIMSETRNMDAALRIEKINDARVRIGADPYLMGDDIILDAIEHGVCKELVLNDSDFGPKLLDRVKAKQDLENAEIKKIFDKRLAELEKKAELFPEMTYTESGLGYYIIKEGFGPKPSDSSVVELHYEGQLLDGTIFDSSITQGVPAQFGVNQVIPGFAEALLLMPQGSKWRIILPPDIAYGPGGTGPIPANATLIFDIDLIKSNVDQN